ncbi:MAG: hypothetical protein ABI905_05465 [Betaproteobacteria bacterium]
MKRTFVGCSVLLSALFVSGADSAAPAPAPAKPVILKPGKPHEKCMVLDAGQKLEYRFESTAKINFNLHYDKGDGMYYPVKLDRTLGESGIYETKGREKYCLAWENRTDADVELNYSYRLSK